MKPKAMVRLTGGTLLVVAGLAVWPVSTTTETVGTESDPATAYTPWEARGIS